MHAIASRRRILQSRLTIGVILIVLALSSIRAQTSPGVQGGGSQEPAAELHAGSLLERELAGGQYHTFTLTVPAGDSARITVEQRAIDVGLRVLDPQGQLVVYVDGEIRVGQPESLVLAAERDSVYSIRVEARDLKAPKGTYRISLVTGPAAADDKAAYESRRLWTQSTLAEGKSVGEALELTTRALAVAEQVTTPDQRWIVELLTRAGEMTARTGKREEAERLFERAIAVADATIGREHPQSTLARIRLGVLYMNADDFVRAEPLLEEGVTTTERVLGEHHPRVAANVIPYALLQTLRRDWEKAYAALHKGIAIAEVSIDPRDFTYISLVNNLGDAYLQQNEIDKAEPFVTRALEMVEKRFGPDDIRVANPVANLGIIAREKKAFSRALTYFDRAYAIRTKVLGASNATTAGTLISIGNVHHAKGDYQEALNTLQKALEVLEVSAGPYHRLTMMALANMARTSAAMGEVAAAISFQARVEHIVERITALNLRIGSERQKLAYLDDDTRLRTSRTVSFSNQLAPDDPAAVRLASQVVLQRKGRVLDAMAGASAALRDHLDDESRGLFDELQGVTAEFSALSLNGPGRTPFPEYEKRLRALEQQQESLEAQISRRSGAFRAATQPLTLAAVQAAIPAPAALIEFVTYQTFSAVAAEEREAYGETRYAAYVIRASGDPIRADLGPAAKIDAAIESLRGALRDWRRADVKKLSRALDAMVFEPIRRTLGDTTRLLISPDGALNLVPFEALVDARGRYAIESFAIGYLTSGRDLLRLQVPRESQSGPLVIADPEFGEPGEPAASSRRSVRGQRRSITSARDLRSTYFAPLSGTAQEAREIHSLFPQATVLTRHRATKAALRSAPAPAILHIASHGFFLEDTAPLAGAKDTRAAEAMAQVLENPLIRSGMALAQANVRRGPTDSGILTALEAANLNLWGTQLVTLSACDTGVGQVVQGEGVYGLRRAFLLAGAESIVMSLWPVSDRVTREMMKAYYTGLKDGRGRGEALRRTQLDMLKRGGRSHPFFWAGFIQAGAWTPLDTDR